MDDQPEDDRPEGPPAFRKRNDSRKVIVGLVVVAVFVAIVVVLNLTGVTGGTDAKSKACTEMVNESSARDVAAGYPAHSRADSQQRYENCMDSPLVDDNGNLKSP